MSVTVRQQTFECQQCGIPMLGLEGDSPDALTDLHRATDVCKSRYADGARPGAPVKLRGKYVSWDNLHAAQIYAGWDGERDPKEGPPDFLDDIDRDDPPPPGLHHLIGAYWQQLAEKVWAVGPFYKMEATYFE